MTVISSGENVNDNGVSLYIHVCSKYPDLWLTMESPSTHVVNTQIYGMHTSNVLPLGPHFNW